MTKSRFIPRLSLLAAMGLSILGPRAAGADPVTCARGIATASAKYVDGRAKGLFKCEDAKVRYRLRPDVDCATDELFDSQHLSLETRLVVGINQACGGPNAACGHGDDQPLGPVGWGIGQCPDFGNAGCTNPITSCLDVAECLKCMNDASVAAAMGLTYGAFETDEFGTKSTVNRCQRAIGKATTKYLRRRAKAMASCWDARLAGTHANVCPEPGDGRAGRTIDSAEARKQSSICKACGGADRACNGAGDLSLAAIGFISTCPG